MVRNQVKSKSRLCSSGGRSSRSGGGSRGHSGGLGFASLDGLDGSDGRDDRCNRSRGSGIHSNGSSGSIRGSRGSSLSGGAVARNVTGLATLVADLAGLAQRATVGGGAVTGDVTKLAAGIALHGLGLAVAGEVVGTTTLVAHSSAGEATKVTTEATLALEAATSSSSGAAASVGDSRASAVALCIL